MQNHVSLLFTKVWILILLSSLGFSAAMAAPTTCQVSYLNIDEQGYATQCGTSYSCPAGTVIHVTLGTPARDGYSFLGWFSALEGGTQYTAGESITVNTDISIYAHWQSTTPEPTSTSLPATSCPLPQKRLINDHLYILINNEYYDITGQPLR